MDATTANDNENADAGEHDLSANVIGPSFIAVCIAVMIVTVAAMFTLHTLVPALTLMPLTVLSIGCMYLTVLGPESIDE